MNKILLDTDVIINLLKKKQETLEKLHTLGECQFYISPIVIAEVYTGARRDEIPQIEALLHYFESLDITSEIGVATGEYANTFRKAFQDISLEDYMIAATAKAYGLQVWTYNKKHFPMRDIVII